VKQERIPETGDLVERVSNETGEPAGKGRLLGASTSAISKILHRIAQESSE
jgi:hypothetical protein